MAFLQADLTHAHIRDDPLRIDPLLLGQVLADDGGHHLGTDAQPPRDFLFAGADQPADNLLFKTVGVRDVLALEGRQDFLPSAAARTVVHGGADRRRSWAAPTGPDRE